ncbi:MAG: hypothetical protein WC120_03125 [Parcubacteria group bacterium]
MLKINPTNRIIYFFLALFLASSAYLFAIDSRYNNPEYNTDWYAVSFTDPKSDRLDFAIENFSSRTDFHWEILADNTEKISQGDVEIKTGERKELSPLGNVSDKKMTIRVSTGENVQEIYKNIRN